MLYHWVDLHRFMGALRQKFQCYTQIKHWTQASSVLNNYKARCFDCGALLKIPHIYFLPRFLKTARNILDPDRHWDTNIWDNLSEIFSFNVNLDTVLSVDQVKLMSIQLNLLQFTIHSVKSWKCLNYQNFHIFILSKYTWAHGHTIDVSNLQCPYFNNIQWWAIMDGRDQS